MRRFLFWLVVLEGSALVALAGIFLLSPESVRSGPVSIPVFRSPLEDAVTGERAEYELRDLLTGESRGFLSYEIKGAVRVRRPNLGVRFEIEIVRRGARGTRQESRRIIHIPRMHGFFPPRLDEDSMPASQRPVMKSVRSSKVSVGQNDYPGFVVEAVWPEWGLGEIKDRLWLTDRVPVFGLARRETEGAEWVLTDLTRPEKRP